MLSIDFRYCTVFGVNRKKIWVHALRRTFKSLLEELLLFWVVVLFLCIEVNEFLSYRIFRCTLTPNVWVGIDYLLNHLQDGLIALRAWTFTTLVPYF